MSLFQRLCQSACQGPPTHWQSWCHATPQNVTWLRAFKTHKTYFPLFQYFCGFWKFSNSVKHAFSNKICAAMSLDRMVGGRYAPLWSIDFSVISWSESQIDWKWSVLCGAFYYQCVYPLPLPNKKQLHEAKFAGERQWSLAEGWPKSVTEWYTNLARDTILILGLVARLWLTPDTAWMHTHLLDCRIGAHSAKTWCRLTIIFPHRLFIPVVR